MSHNATKRPGNDSTNLYKCKNTNLKANYKCNEVMIKWADI
jgi:hypothetical protein